MAQPWKTSLPPRPQSTCPFLALCTHATVADSPRVNRRSPKEEETKKKTSIFDELEEASAEDPLFDASPKKAVRCITCPVC